MLPTPLLLLATLPALGNGVSFLEGGVGLEIEGMCCELDTTLLLVSSTLERTVMDLPSDALS